MGEWEVIDSYYDGEDSFFDDIGQRDLEILEDGTTIFIDEDLDSTYAIVLNLKFITGDQLVLYSNAGGYALLYSYQTDEDHLNLSFENDYHLYGRKNSN